MLSNGQIDINIVYLSTIFAGLLEREAVTNRTLMLKLFHRKLENYSAVFMIKENVIKGRIQ